MSHYKVAIVGSKEAIIGFKAVGLTPFFYHEGMNLVELLTRLKKETANPEISEKFAIIFITEDIAQKISPDDWKKLNSSALPALVSIPSHQGSTGFGVKRLNQIVERAIGSNIFND